jgi:peptidoglycan glycosyltransferase
VNTPIIRIYTLFLLLFALLVYFTSKWTVFDAEKLEDRGENRRPLIAEQQIERGEIKTADGELIAESVPQNEARNPIFSRRYPAGELFGNPVGYSFVEVGRTGIESSENDLLSGEENEFESIIDQLQAEPPVGADLTLTLDAEAQRVGMQALEGAVGPGVGGSVVAIEPDTGAVKAMASIPGYDPNVVTNERVFSELSTDKSAPLVNRPTQSTYEPGSTMKVVTVSAALDSGEFSPDTTLNADSPKDISGFPLENAGGEDFGTIDATDALTNSVNTYWAQVGEQLGADTYFEYMDRFGFNKDPQLAYPDNQMAPSGVYEQGKLLDPTDSIDIGRVAIGQERLLTTPMQMAEVAATIANGGELMKPTFVQEAKDPDGREVADLDPDVQERVVSEETAATVTEMMTNVVNEGTASGLSVSSGQLAGKTGTAEIDVEASINRPWFIGFAPADDPQIAVAAMIERCTGCFGGEVAGPIATQVMDSLLAG